MTPAEVRPLWDAQQAFRRAYLEQAYVAFQGNVAHLARALKLDRPHTYRLLHAYNIAPERWAHVGVDHG